MTTDQQGDALLHNALHAARTWLERLGAEPDAIAVVGIFPTPTLGTWLPGTPNVRQLAAIGDDGAEVCEAVAPLVHHALGRLDANVRARALMATQPDGGSRLQALIAPGGVVLRVVGPSGPIELMRVEVTPLVH